MTRDLHPDTAAAMAARDQSLRLFAEVDTSDGALRLWTGLGDLSFDGMVFTGAGDLLGASAIEETTSLDERTLSIQLSAIPTDLLSLASNAEVQGRTARIWLAVVNGRQIVGAPKQIYAGRGDVFVTEDDGATFTATLTVNSVLARWKSSKLTRYTDARQQAKYPGDKFFEFISQSEEKTPRWGPNA